MSKKNTFCYLLIGFLVAVAQAIPALGQSLKGIYATGTVSFDEEMILDESGLPEGEFFEGIVDIGIDDEGNIYLCDIGACNIKKFSPDGNFLKIIGRKGQGPGEFSMPWRMAVTSDRLFVYDGGNRRLCTFTTEGEQVKCIGIKSTLFTHQVMRNKFRNIQGMFSNIMQPFSPDVYWDVVPDGRIVIGLAEDYTVQFHHPEKGLLSSFKHAYEPIRVTDQDKERFFSGITFGTSQGGSTELPEEIKKLTEFPKTKPAFDALLVDSEGNILVHTVRKASEDSAPRFDAFDPDEIKKVPDHF